MLQESGQMSKNNTAKSMAKNGSMLIF